MTIVINLGLEEYVLPLVENCLRDNDGKFYSAQNAFRVHEWLRGTSVNPLVLEAVKPETNGSFLERKLGMENARAFAERWHAGWLLKIEQRALATPEIQKLMAANIEYLVANPSEANKIAVSETTHKVMTFVTELEAFNASNLYFQTVFPKRFLLETMNVLDMLFSCIITQRSRVVIGLPVDNSVVYPEKLFNTVELDKVIARLHQAVLERYFPHPEVQAKTDGFLDGSFFRQCAMAYSKATGAEILEAYLEKPGKVYIWASQVLNSLKDTIPAMQVRPKPKAAAPGQFVRQAPQDELAPGQIVPSRNVVSLFKNTDGQDKTPT